MAAKKYVKHLKWLIDLQFTHYCYMQELEIGLVDRGEFSFNQSFLQFNVKKKIQAKSYFRFDNNCWKLDTANSSIKQLIYCYNNANFTVAFLSERHIFLRSLRCETYLFHFYRAKIMLKAWSVQWTFQTYLNNCIYE